MCRPRLEDAKSKKKDRIFEPAQGVVMSLAQQQQLQAQQQQAQQQQQQQQQQAQQQAAAAAAAATAAAALRTPAAPAPSMLSMMPQFVYTPSGPVSPVSPMAPSMMHSMHSLPSSTPAVSMSLAPTPMVSAVSSVHTPAPLALAPSVLSVSQPSAPAPTAAAAAAAAPAPTSAAAAAAKAVKHEDSDEEDGSDYEEDEQRLQASGAAGANGVPHSSPSSIPACLHCRRSKVKCDGGIPCTRCLRLGLQASCERCQPKKRGRKRKERDVDTGAATATATANTTSVAVSNTAAAAAAATTTTAMPTPVISRVSLTQDAYAPAPSAPMTSASSTSELYWDRAPAPAAPLPAPRLASGEPAMKRMCMNPAAMPMQAPPMMPSMMRPVMPSSSVPEFLRALPARAFEAIESDLVDDLASLAYHFRTWLSAITADPSVDSTSPKFLRFLYFCRYLRALAHSHLLRYENDVRAPKMVSLWLSRTLITETDAFVANIEALLPAPGAARNDLEGLHFGVEKQVYKDMPVGVAVLPLQPFPMAAPELSAVVAGCVGRPFANAHFASLLGFSVEELRVILGDAELFGRLVAPASMRVVTQLFWEAVESGSSNFVADISFSSRLGQPISLLCTYWIKYADGLPSAAVLFSQDAGVCHQMDNTISSGAPMSVPAHASTAMPMELVEDAYVPMEYSSAPTAAPAPSSSYYAPVSSSSSSSSSSSAMMQQSMVQQQHAIMQQHMQQQQQQQQIQQQQHLAPAPQMQQQQQQQLPVQPVQQVQQVQQQHHYYVEQPSIESVIAPVAQAPLASAAQQESPSSLSPSSPLIGEGSAVGSSSSLTDADWQSILFATYNEDAPLPLDAKFFPGADEETGNFVF